MSYQVITSYLNYNCIFLSVLIDIIVVRVICFCFPFSSLRENLHPDARGFKLFLSQRGALLILEMSIGVLMVARVIETPTMRINHDVALWEEDLKLDDSIKPSPNLQ